MTIIDDYAHHPTEIMATLKAAKNCPHKKLWCVFQPHTYTRTKALMDDFAKALSMADEVVLADIYAARETDTLGHHFRYAFGKRLRPSNPRPLLPFLRCDRELPLENAESGDLLLTMGAGDVYQIGEHILGK
ncbi:MAG: glutamate ligase domain-containing protein [Lachnospiraceae bacterium]